jgi:hypothetical protein
MNLEMQKANLLADNINGFIQFVNNKFENKNNTLVNIDKLYQVKLVMEDFRFQVLADELRRINRFDWDEKYTHYLVNKFKKGINIIDEYVKINANDLFIISARIYTFKNLCQSFTSKKPQP